MLQVIIVKYMAKRTVCGCLSEASQSLIVPAGKTNCSRVLNWTSSEVPNSAKPALMLAFHSCMP